MEENNVMKVAHVINLPTLNTKSQLNINIDANTHIKQILNIQACLIEAQTESLFNKAIIKGSIGIKVVYIDTDNMYNSLSDTVNFSETINDDRILADCEITINNSQFVAEFDHDDSMLKVGIDGNIECLCSLSSTLSPFNNTSENLIVKKSVLQACSCVQRVNKTTNFDYDFKLDCKINKMLSCDSKIVVEDIKCYDGYAIISGQILNTIIYEVDNNGYPIIKTSINNAPFKSEVEATYCSQDCDADLSAYINLNSTQITTDVTDNDTKFNFEYCIVVEGHIYKTVNMDIAEDLYSVNSEVEVVNNNYTICKKMPYFKTTESIDAEITLADELNVDEILSMVNTSSNVTQYSVKDNVINIEGVVNGNLLYLDENREVKHLATQLPFSINIKQDILGEVCALHSCVVPSSCKCKIKRGNTLIVDYELCVSGCVYTQSQIQLIDSVKYGKNLDYGDIAFQIYLAHANETCWDLCKRLHISQEQLVEYNKETPATYMGGEKIIVYR